MQRPHMVGSGIDENQSERQTTATSQAVKPLPPLPRGWPRVCHETGLFLRGIGLGILVTAFQGFFTTNFLEPEKVAIRQSRITALLRTLIHVVPLGVAIFEIVLNLRGHFVGREFDKQNYLQFAAKAHEIAMQASIATVLLSYIRSQISADKGMPFGAVLSGLQFLQVSYLWSLELWSSILSKDFQRRKKTCFAVLILVCVIVAATAGPSSASLLIPRQGLWPTASTYLAFNVSDLDMWPDRLDDKKIGRDCAMVRSDSLDNTPRCPISDLYNFLDEDHRVILAVIDPPDHSIDEILMQTAGTGFYRALIMSHCRMSLGKDQFCFTIPRANVLDGFFSEKRRNSSLLQSEGYKFVRKNYYQPYTIVSCVADVVRDASDLQAPLRFARISETETELTKDREIFSMAGLTKGRIINNVSGDNSNFRVDWVDLPMDVFNTGVPGAVIVSSQDPNGLLYNVTTCTLNAGWGSSTVITTEQKSFTVSSHMSDVPSSWSDEKVVFDSHGFMFSDVPYFSNISNFPYPQRRISVSKDWIEFLNPTVVLNNNSTETFISLMLSTLESQPSEANVARLLGQLLVVAIADTGKENHWEVFSDLKNITRTCDTCSVFEIDYAVYGWLYLAHGKTTILAITVMLAYCALVFGHVVYSAISGVSSTAWDSAAELVALAMNSSPTEILRNTCAGIAGRQALNTPVRVFATSPGHLELVFGKVTDPNAQNSRLVMNEKYGNRTGGDDNEDEELELTQGTLRKRAITRSSE